MSKVIATPNMLRVVRHKDRTGEVSFEMHEQTDIVVRAEMYEGYVTAWPLYRSKYFALTTEECAQLFGGG